MPPLSKSSLRSIIDDVKWIYGHHDRVGHILTHIKVRKLAKIRNRNNQVPLPHLANDTTWESDKTQLNITNEIREVSPFPTGDYKAAMNRRNSMTNTDQTQNVNNTQ